MDFSQLWTIIWSAVGVILTGLASWATAALVNWLNTKIKDEKLAKLSTSLAKIIMGAVEQVMQTYVSTMKNAGKFDEAAQKEAFNKCKAVITTQLTPELKDFISDNFGDIESYLTTQIEATIYSLKSNK